MANQPIDRTGKIGRLTILGKAEPRKSKSGRDLVYWAAVCECGTYKEIANTNITRTQSCGCIRKGNPNNPNYLPPGMSIRNTLLADYKRSAARRELEWGLTDVEFFNLTQGNCHYCGISPCTVLKGDHKNGTYTYNGVDRKDNSCGYIAENVVSCCKFCQYAKRDLLYEMFIEHLKRAGKYQLNQGTMRAFIG